MATESAGESPATRRRLLASPWHTAGLVAILAVVFVAGAALQSRAGAGPGIVGQHRGVMGVYLSALVLDWLLFYYVWAFTRKAGTPLRDLVGGKWASAKDVAIDVAITIPFWVVWELTAQGTHRLLGPSAAKSVDILLPQSIAEIVVWMALSLTAGFCEEAVFPGYVQKQFHALTGSAALAVVFQAVLFGAGHGYQGIKKVMVITVLGGLYGLLALWRKSLRPGMVAHAWSDIYGGLQLHFLLKLF